MGTSFIRDDQIQAEIVSRLKSRAAILALVASDEIREDYWQGVEFSYPNVRVRLISNIPQNVKGCMHKFECGVQVFSETASSLQSDQIAGIIANELHSSQFESNNLAFIMNVTNAIPAVRQDLRTWRSEILVRGIVSG